MKNSIDYRSFSAGDEHSIIELFHISFGKKMPLDFWKWRFRENPVDKIMIEMAWDGETLAAHYAVSPVVISVRGQDYYTALSMTTMTHPNYRGQGLFPKLANRLYERLKQHRYLMVWGFPNDQSHRGFVKHLSWENIYEIPTFYLDLNYLKFIPKLSDHIVKVPEPDDRFDLLWERVRSEYDILVRRDQRYLNWRFSLNPQSDYIFFGYIERTSLLGYVVFKKYQDCVDIVDFLCVADSGIGIELIFAVINFCLQNNAKGINMWLPVHHHIHLDLEKIGFCNTAPVTYFGGYELDPFSMREIDIGNVRHWYYMMGDSDVF